MNPKRACMKKKIFQFVLICFAVAVIAVVSLCSQPVRYRSAERMLERGEYTEARQAFEALGDYKDAAKQAEEAEKGLVYQEAQTLLQAGKYREAGDLLAGIANYRDAAGLLEELKRYDQACGYMALHLYEDAAEAFLTLGDFLDAAEKVTECQRLNEINAAYEDGVWQFRSGKWLDAYRTLSAIRGEDYRDTKEMLEEISTVAEELVLRYAEQGERGKLLAFLRLIEEIDPAAGAALRQELVQAEAFEEDWSYFQFNPKCLTSCSPDTTADEYAATLLYMILNGGTELTLQSDSELDKAAVLGEFYLAQNILGDSIPGYGLIYAMDITVEKTSMKINLRYEDNYSEEEFHEIIETYETFCEESVRELVEAGMLSASMTYRQKAQVISEWVGFYLTYDKMQEIYLAGVALEEGKGVCSAYASLYHRMCNLVGVPTYGQGGTAYDPVSYGPHIWLIHVDETGTVYYADPTWADPWDMDFSTGEERATVAQFVDHYLERCMEEAVSEYRNPSGAKRGDGQYFWSRSIWVSTHKADRMAEDIIAAHLKLQGKNP